jgi:hypothetical protein
MPKDESEFLDKLSFNCKSKSQGWQPSDMYIFNPKKEKGNFYSLGGIGALAFDETVLDIMQTVFEMAGEILPIKIDNEIVYILNVLECVNALDETNVKWQIYPNGSRGRILSYSFYNNRLTESSVFKIPETSKGDILAYSGVNDPEDEFYSLYMKHNLKGLLFEEIYEK